MPLTLQEALEKDVDTNVTVKATCLDVGEIETVNNKKRFYAVLADESGTCTVTIYNAGYHASFIKNSGIFLINAIAKGSYLAVTTRSKVGLCTAVPVPDGARASPPVLPSDGLATITTAMSSPPKSLVSLKGKVMKKSSPGRKQANDVVLNFQEILLRDRTGSTTVALWGDLVNKVDTGDMIRLRRCRVKLFDKKNVKKLSSTAYSSLELMKDDDDLADVEMLPEDQDVLFECDEQPRWTHGTLIAVSYTDIYYGCPLTGCHQSKTITEISAPNTPPTLRCSVCKRATTASVAVQAYLARLLVVQACDNIELTFFTAQLRELLNLADPLLSLEDMDIPQLTQALIGILPKSVVYTANKNVCTSIKLE